MTNNGSNWNRIFNVRRKAAKRTLPFDLTEEELELLTPPHDEAIPARKKPRLEMPLLLERLHHLTFGKGFPLIMQMQMQMQIP
jgi:hypothetical protein